MSFMTEENSQRFKFNCHSLMKFIYHEFERKGCAICFDECNKFTNSFAVSDILKVSYTMAK